MKAKKTAKGYGATKKSNSSMSRLKVKDNRQCVKAGTFDAKKTMKG